MSNDDTSTVTVHVADTCLICGGATHEGAEVHLYEVKLPAGHQVPAFDDRGRLRFVDVRFAWAHRGHLS